jgi:hypothetical protein
MKHGGGDGHCPLQYAEAPNQTPNLQYIESLTAPLWPLPLRRGERRFGNETVGDCTVICIPLMPAGWPKIQTAGGVVLVLVLVPTSFSTHCTYHRRDSSVSSLHHHTPNPASRCESRTSTTGLSRIGSAKFLPPARENKVLSARSSRRPRMPRAPICKAAFRIHPQSS